MTLQELFPKNFPKQTATVEDFRARALALLESGGGFEDTRGTLFFEIMRLARLQKPKYLFLENVKGLLSHDGGRTFGTILSVMGECGYDAEYQVLNSKDFGVPQNRERVFIIGHLRGKSRPKVFPIRGTNRKTLKQIIGGSQGYRVYNPEGLSCTLANEAGGMGAKTGLYLLNSTKEGHVYCLDANYSKGTSTINKGRRTLIKKVGTLTGSNSQSDRIYHVNGLSPTISAGNRGGGKRPGGFFTDGVSIRRLTPKECFRLQGFPDDYFERAAEVNSDTQLYKQAGNSVTVNVVYEIARRLKKSGQNHMPCRAFGLRQDYHSKGIGEGRI